MSLASRAVNALCVLVVIGAVVTVAGCGGKATATPIHQANVFFDGISHDDFRQACSVLELKNGATVAECSAYFTLSTAISGGGITAHAVPHSEKVRGDTATVKGVDSQGTHYVVTLARIHGEWRLTSVQAA